MFSSTAGAAEYAGAVLGEFVRIMELEGRPFYKQRNTEGSRSVFLGSGGLGSTVGWLVTDLGNSSGLLTNDQDSDLPPKANWLYYNYTNMSNDDQTLKLDYTTLSSSYKLVTVAGSSCELNNQSARRLGDYRFASIVQ